MIEDDNLRILPCPICGTEGVLIYAHGNNPDADREEECPECEGCGMVLAEVAPITFDDLEDAFGL